MTETIRETIKQTRPFDSVKTELVLTLMRTTDRVQEAANRSIVAAGLSGAQYNVLRILRGCPPGLQTHEVCGRMVARAPNITRLVDKLEKKGLLTRSRSRKDRRVVTLRITRAGLRLLETLETPIRTATHQATAGLDDGETARLLVLLNRLCAPLEGRVNDGKPAVPRTGTAGATTPEHHSSTGRGRLPVEGEPSS
jgi:DNA-binding MarR family transcriptional regulator